MKLQEVCLEMFVDNLNIIIRILGILGILTSLVGMQCKKHKNLLYFRIANEAFFALQYLLLGGYTGALLNVISSIRNIFFVKFVKKGKSTFPLRFIFSFIFIVMAIITWAGRPTLTFCIGKIITTFIYGSKNMPLVRILTIVSCIMWIIYNVSVGAYEGIVSDAVCIASTVAAIIRIDIIGKKASVKC